MITRILIAIALLVSLTGCGGGDEATTAQPTAPAGFTGEQFAETPGADGVGNPASVHCEENGGTEEIRTDEAGEQGVCVFEDGSECDSWAYFHGECPPGESPPS